MQRTVANSWKSKSHISLLVRHANTSSYIAALYGIERPFLLWLVVCSAVANETGYIVYTTKIRVFQDTDLVAVDTTK